MLGLADGGQLQRVEEYPESRSVPGALIVRIEENLHFANIGEVQALLRRIESFGSAVVHPSADRIARPADAILIDLSPVRSWDASGFTS